MLKIYSKIYFSLIKDPVSKDPLDIADKKEVFMKLYKHINLNNDFVFNFDNYSLKLLKNIHEGKKTDSNVRKLSYRIEKLYKKYLKRNGYRYHEIVESFIYNMVFLIFAFSSIATVSFLCLSIQWLIEYGFSLLLSDVFIPYGITFLISSCICLISFIYLYEYSYIKN